MNMSDPKGWKLIEQNWKVGKEEASGPIRPVLGFVFEDRDSGEKKFGKFKYRLAEMVLEHQNGQIIRYRFCDKNNPKFTRIMPGKVEAPTMTVGKGKTRRTVYDRITDFKEQDALTQKPKKVKEQRTEYTPEKFIQYMFERWGEVFGGELLHIWADEGYLEAEMIKPPVVPLFSEAA